MKRFLFNGKMLAEGTALASPGTRGLRYGDGLFETIACQNGVPLRLSAHCNRLWKGMEVLKFIRPRLLTIERLDKEIRQLLHSNGHEKLARVRLQLFRTEGGLYDPVTDLPSYYIESWEIDGDTNVLNTNGLVLGLFKDAWKSCDVLANLKHSNYLPYLLAAQFAREQRWNDAVLLNQYGRICDSTIANIFIVKNGKLITPALSEGCVAGIMRHQLIEILPQKGFYVEEGQLHEEDLLSADEIFLTNSIRPVRWVQSFGNKSLDYEVTAAVSRIIQSTIG